MNVHIQAGVNGRTVGNGKLDLIHADRFVQTAVQQLDLHRIMIAHTETSDLARLL